MSEIEEQLAEVCETVWELALSMGLERCDPDRFCPGNSDSWATVNLIGGDVNSLILECSTEAARLAAGVMFGLEQTEISPEDMQDTVGELVNVIGGNLRGVFDGNTGIATPSVACGQCSVIESNHLVGQVAFECDGHPFRVSLTTSLQG